MRNIEKLRDYFLGKDPQLKETMADNSLRLIGIEGKYFVLRSELIAKLKKLRDELTAVDEELQREIDGVIHDLQQEATTRQNEDNALGRRITDEATARQNADNSLGNRISNIETWKNNTNFVLADDLALALAGYYTKSEADDRYVNIAGDTMTGSLAIGGDCIASGDASFAQGIGAQATGFYSHAEGSSTTASEFVAHAEGVLTRATGASSHAEGTNTEASGTISHAEGGGTIAAGDTQHVQGMFNIADTTSSHIVGNGTDSDHRSNAHTLDWSGNAWYAGDIYVGSTSGTHKDEGSHKVETEDAMIEYLHDNMQEKLEAGSYISIVGNVISSTPNIPSFEISYDDPLDKFDDYIGKLVYITHFTSRQGGLYPDGTDEFNDVYYVTTRNQETELLSLRCITYGGATASNMFYQNTYQPDTTVWDYAVHMIDNVWQTISSSSTNNQLPTAKAVYDFVIANSGDIIDVDSNVTLDNNTEPGIYYNNGNAQVRILSGYDSSVILAIDPQNFFMIERHTNDIAVTSWGVIGDIHRKTYNVVNHQVGSIQKTFSLIEQTSNKATSLSSSSTDVQYPSAKCVYDYVQTEVGNIASALQNINTGNGV